MREEQLAPKARVTWSQARQMAAQLGSDPAKIMARSGRLSGLEMLTIRNIVRANTEAAMLPRRSGAVTAPGRDRWRERWRGVALCNVPLKPGSEPAPEVVHVLEALGR